MSNLSSMPEILGYIFSVVGVVVAFLYFARPTYKICPEFEKEKIRVTILNTNILRTSMTNVRCEIVASKSPNFKRVKTLDLLKEWTPRVKYLQTYVFVSPEGDLDHRYYRIQIISNNILGVLKVNRKQYIYRLDDNSNFIKTKPEC